MRRPRAVSEGNHDGTTWMENSAHVFGSPGEPLGCPPTVRIVPTGAGTAAALRQSRMYLSHEPIAVEWRAPAVNSRSQERCQTGQPPKNLQYLCPNCDSQRPTRGGFNKGRVRDLSAGGYLVAERDGRRAYTLIAEPGAFQLKGHAATLTIGKALKPTD